MVEVGELVEIDGAVSVFVDLRHRILLLLWRRAVYSELLKMDLIRSVKFCRRRWTICCKILFQNFSIWFDEEEEYNFTMSPCPVSDHDLLESGEGVIVSVGKSGGGGATAKAAAVEVVFIILVQLVVVNLAIGGFVKNWWV